MDIYLVRHGQTSGNVARRHQAEKTPLTKVGEAQVAETALKLAQVEPSHLISSHLNRAIESARIISDATNLDIEVDHHFAELVRPRYLEGKFHFSPQSAFYYVMWFLGIENRQLAGESYAQVRQRVAVAKNVLKRYPKDAKVVVVSHSVFINLFVAHMSRARSLNIFSLIGVISKIFRIPNAGIIHIQFDEAAENALKWQVVPPTNENSEAIESVKAEPDL